MVARTMRLPMVAAFVDRASGQKVAARIRLTTERDILAWTRWRYRRTDEDRDWDWWDIFRECSLSGGDCECYSALARDELHGLMVLDLRARVVQRTAHLVVDYLATHPANRRLDEGLKHVGSALLSVAVLRSREQGMSGRVWLESLGGARSFYEGLGMRKLTGKSEEGNAMYVLESPQADQLLAIVSAKGIVQV